MESSITNNTFTTTNKIDSESTLEMLLGTHQSLKLSFHSLMWRNRQWRAVSKNICVSWMQRKKCAANCSNSKTLSRLRLIMRISTYKMDHKSLHSQEKGQEPGKSRSRLIQSTKIRRPGKLIWLGLSNNHMIASCLRLLRPEAWRRWEWGTRQMEKI